MNTEAVLSSASFRTVERLVEGIPTSDGAGVRLTRVLTPDLQRRLDPFLMLDAFRNEHADDYLGGFPDHPHRGFETVTYMIAGRMRHRDSVGNEGLLGPGGAQWMTTGSGLIHSELPEQEAGLMEGFQLWLNLPARHKMVAPSYRDLPAASHSGIRRRRGCPGARHRRRQPRRQPVPCSARTPSRSFWTCICRRGDASCSRLRPGTTP
jgi:redox-sensitive bicupin YhaK (pirin superfamily)